MNPGLAHSSRMFLLSVRRTVFCSGSGHRFSNNLLPLLKLALGLLIEQKFLPPASLISLSSYFIILFLSLNTFTSGTPDITGTRGSVVG
jgi:hypothetical protein